jgi:hypothetical protein
MAHVGLLLACFLGLAAAIGWSLDRKAREAGFESLFERFSAAGYVNARTYHAVKAAEEEEERRAEIARRAREGEQETNALGK